MEVVGLFIVGVLSGVIAGMGMGGGTFLIPMLIIFFNFNQTIAQMNNLFAFLPMAVVSLIIHFKNKLVDFKKAIPLMVGGVCSSVPSSIFANSISSDILKTIFGIFLLLVGVYQIIFTLKTYFDNKKVPQKNFHISFGFKISK